VLTCPKYKYCQLKKHELFCHCKWNVKVNYSGNAPKCAFLRKFGCVARVNEGSHSFTCHPHVYLQVEWTMPAFCCPAAERHRTLGGTHFPYRWGYTSLSWPEWVATNPGGLSARRRSPMHHTQHGSAGVFQVRAISQVDKRPRFSDPCSSKTR